MNKLTIYIVGVVIVVGGISTVLITQNGDDGVIVSDVATGKSEEVTFTDDMEGINACDLLTEDVAKIILGDLAKNGELPAGQAVTKDIAVSDCVYTARIDPSAPVSLANTKGVSLLIRSAKTSKGVDSNNDQFGAFKPSGVQDVEAIGDNAFFNPEFGQLNVLKDGNWYIVNSYIGNAGIGTLDSNKELANLLNL